MDCRSLSWRLSTVCVLLLFSAAPFSDAYPNMWYDANLRASEGLSIADLTCVQHPSQSYSTAPHGTPRIDSAITFAFTDKSTNAATNTLCPGGSYNLKVSFSTSRLALLTADPATAATFTSPSPTAGCSNRVDLGGSIYKYTSFTSTFTVACSAAGSSVLFKITSASRDKQWYYNSMTINVAAVGGSCTACGGSTASSNPPPPQGSPPTTGGGSGNSHVLPSPPPTPPPPTPAASSPSGCTPSGLGYQCAVTKGKVTFHWSLNTQSAPPNECTPATKTVLQSSELSTVGSLHVAVQSAVTGYVSIGFGNDPNEMYPSDLVLGWAGSGSSAAFVKSFYVTSEDLDDTNIYPASGDSWAYDSGVVRSATTGVTTVCFSRRLKDSRAPASPDLSASASISTSGRRRQLAQGANDGSSLGLIWAVSNSQAFVQHRSSDVGGFWLDPTSGSTVEAVGRKEMWIIIHGALMAVAWGLLLPLGAMIPANRWLIGTRLVFGKQMWFVAHLATQWTGIILFALGIVVAYVRLGDASGEAGSAHSRLAIAVMAVAGTQLVIAYIRPDPNHQYRGIWNTIHHTLGRMSVILAWVNLYIGISIFHAGQWAAASYAAWITPLATVMGLLVFLDVVLRQIDRSRVKDCALPPLQSAGTNQWYPVTVAPPPATGAPATWPPSGPPSATPARNGHAPVTSQVRPGTPPSRRDSSAIAQTVTVAP